MTIYAWVVALLSIPLTAYSAKFDRRPLLLTLVTVFVGAHVLTTVAWSFNVLIVARLFVAVAHAVFWAIAIPFGIRLAPPGKREHAMSIVATGATLGSVLGIPFGTLLGQLFGWRMGFGAIGICAAIVGLVLYVTLPSTPSQGAGDLAVIKSLFGRRKLVLVYILTVVTMTGHYAAFTFISPYLQQIGLMKPEWITSVLLVFGCAGLAGSYLAPRLINTALKRSALVSIGLVSVSLFAMYFVMGSYPLTLIMAFFWGSSFLLFNLILQSLVLALAPDAEDVAMAGFSGIYNVGIGGGALLGSLFSAHQLSSLGFIGSGVTLLALATTVYLMRGNFVSRLNIRAAAGH